MSKIKLGQRPEAFKPFPVKFTMPDGSDGSITATFKYRTRAEYGTLLNETTKADGQDLPKQESGSVDFEALHRDTAQRNARHLQESLKAWDLDEELSLENLIALATDFPAAALALHNAYQVACIEGRLGN